MQNDLVLEAMVMDKEEELCNPIAMLMGKYNLNP